MSNAENPYPYAWFIRGTQSAIFYYLACTPCYRVRNQRARARQDRRDRAARANMETSGPEMLYRQPSPYATNEYWTDEIRSGPGPPPQRAKKRKDPHKGKNGGEGARIIITEPLPDEQQGSMDGSAPMVAANGNKTAESQSDSQHSTMDDVKSLLRHPTESWNNRRRNYQREDEELWGVESSTDSNSSTNHSRLRPTLHHRHFSVGHIGPSITAGLARLAQKQETTMSSFYAARNPPVNDLHPPIVSVPMQSKEANQWMLQPPPSASIMSGKERARRAVEDGASREASGSGSGSSLAAGSMRNQRGLHRKMSRRLLEEKRRKMDGKDDGLLLQPLPPRTLDRPVSSRSRRKQHLSDESTDSTRTIVHKSSIATSARDMNNATPDMSDNTTNTISTIDTGNTSRRDFALPPLTPLKWDHAPVHRSQNHPKLPYIPRPHAYSPKSGSPSPRSPGARHERQLSSTTRSYMFAYPLPLPTPWKEDPEFARRARIEAWGSGESPTAIPDEDEGGGSHMPQYSRPLSSFESAIYDSPTHDASTLRQLDGELPEASVSQESVLDASGVYFKGRQTESSEEMQRAEDEDLPSHSWNSQRKRWSVGF
ncbi:MAG: hypothetical protein M1828_006417 [Chrysothrix sp. TS-e1954]|nr:MAG: hypothetical protein M1828_006417 [Chrysothrix sp. TS-e1954]